MAQVAGSNKRLAKELADLNTNPLDGISVEVSDENIYKWTAVINGPENTPYKGGKFQLSLDFPIEYPFKTPKVKFLTPIHHPNVDDSGNLCIGLLKAESWKPSTKASSILMAISQLLEEPSPDDALVASIAETYKSDRALFDKQAAEHTKKHAMGK